MDLVRSGSKRIFIHSHHRGFGDPENEPHVHVEDTNGSNSYSLSTGELLQSSRNIDRKTEKWFYEQYYYNKYSWLDKWDDLVVDWNLDLNLELEEKQLVKKK